MLFEIPVTVVIREPLDLSAPKPCASYQHVILPNIYFYGEPSILGNGGLRVYPPLPQNEILQKIFLTGCSTYVSP